MTHYHTNLSTTELYYMTELQLMITVPAYDIALVDDEIVILLVSLWAIVPNMVTWLMLGRHIQVDVHVKRHLDHVMLQ